MAKSQDKRGSVGLDLGYYYNRKNWGNIGLSTSYYNVRPQGVNLLWEGWHLGGGAGVNLVFNKEGYRHYLVGYVNGGIGPLFESKIAFSKYYLNPAVGINLFNTFKLHLGYSIPMNYLDGYQCRGFTLGVVITVGAYRYYSYYHN